MRGSSWKRWVIFFLLLGGVLRLYKITSPVADWHSFRQADTASVTREYVKHGIDLLHPRYHDLSNVQAGFLTNGVDNLEGWRMVEFPLVNAMIAAILRTFPVLDLVTTSRLFSVLASLSAIALFAIFVKRLYSEQVSIFTTAVMALMPYAIFYSRVILPEPYVVFFLCASLLSLDIYLQSRSRWKTLTWASMWVVTMACGLLLKPMMIFIVPAYFALIWHRKGIYGIFDARLAVIGFISAVPLLLWRQWITQYPTGVPWSDWLYNIDGIRLRPAWFRWLFWERITNLMLGIGGVTFATFALFSRSLFVLAWGVGILAYFVIFATGNVRHDYYQVMCIPFLSLLVGLGLSWVVSKPFVRRSLAMQTCLFLLLLGSWIVAAAHVRGYYAINHPEILAAGAAVDRLTPPNAKVIAPYVGDTAFLFATNRTGWPIGQEIEEKISAGASVYVSVNYDDVTNDLLKRYATIERTTDYIILDLKKPI